MLNTTLDKTGKWLLSRGKYVAWKQQSSRALLWVYGKPGSGKSHLAAQIIEQLREACKERDNMDNGQGERLAIEDNVLPYFEIIEPDNPASIPARPHQDRNQKLLDSSQRSNAEGFATGITQASNAETMGDPDIDSEVVQRSKRTALAYIYCDSQLVQHTDRTGLNHIAEPAAGYDTTGLLRALTKQLYQLLPTGQDIQILSDLCVGTENEQPNREEVMKAIKTVIKMFDQTFIVVDGLDEYNRIESLEFEGFCGFLASLTNQDGTGPAANVLNSQSSRIHRYPQCCLWISEPKRLIKV